jgi:hypothetical protein
VLAEIGFFDVPAQPTAARYEARLFYVFEPADVDPAGKPLVVLFNGGPGLATTPALLAYGTGRRTIDPAADAGAIANDNPSRWTTFANLLYIDARQTGFSYGLGGSTDCTMSQVEEASDFVRALLDFLDGHAALRGNPVVLAGESYGGARATWILDLLLRYPTEGAKGGPDLAARIQAHYDAVCPDRAVTVIDEATASRQFGAQVLIEPFVLGQAQLTEQTELMADDPDLRKYVVTSPADPGPLVDSDDALEPPGWTDGLIARATQTMADPIQSARLLGLGLDTVPFLLPAARATAFHDDGATPTDELASAKLVNQALTTRLGALGQGDLYFAPVSLECQDVTLDDPALAPTFVENLRSVRTFITDARFDLAIYSPAIPAMLASMGLGGAVDTSPRPGFDRPGWFTVNFAGTTDAGASSLEVRFPPYAQSGHMVTASQPADLAADVEAWLSGP